MPILILPGGLTAPAPQVSLMPHSSDSGSPIAWKNSSTSTGVGAAPTLIASTWSSPSIARSPAKISRVGLCDLLGELVGHLFAALLEPDLADCGLEGGLHRLRCSSGWPAIIVSRPAFSFSQIRGTAKNQLGLTSGR